MSDQQGTPGKPPIVDTRLRAAIWESLMLDPTIGVAIVTDEGRTLWCNKRQSEIFGGDNATPDMFNARLWSTYFPQDWIDERLKILAEIKATGKPVVLRTIWHGKQQISHMRPIPDQEPGEFSRFLIVTSRQPSGSEQASGTDVRMSEVARLGELQSLTERELEVLALVGQGLTSKEIAALLHRSEKTIENHRYSLSKKLEGASAVALADLAAQAGLRVEDSRRTRV